ncbi:hypothetical protein HanIR_Chr16g0820211 [Helianthus annuus]|nr:hypothetical protein HanIR_Chr16g0820211 [Helianthus annuus]
MSSMLSYLPEQVTYAERNASARVHMKLKLYVSGRRSISHTTFETRPWEIMTRHDSNDANPGSGRTTDCNAANCQVILQATQITTRYVQARASQTNRNHDYGNCNKTTSFHISPIPKWRLHYVRHSMVMSFNNWSSHDIPGKVFTFLLLKFRLLAYSE